jgi:serine/threonine protein kinase
VDLQCNTPSLFRTADPASSVTVAPWIVKNYPLGHGTFGQVYLASQTTAPAVQVACKTVDLQVSAKHSTDVQREIEILEALNHPNICGILDTTYGAQQEAQSTIVHLFMPLVLGGDLFSYMEKHRSLTEDEVRFAAKQLIEGTAYLHKMQVAHRGEPSTSPATLVFVPRWL